MKGLRQKAESGAAAFGTVDTFLAWRLTGGAAHVTDVSNASRTLLMDLATRRWDDRLLSLLGVPRAVLPEIRSSSEIYGTTRGLRCLPLVDEEIAAGACGDWCIAPRVEAAFESGRTLAHSLMSMLGVPAASLLR